MLLFQTHAAPNVTLHLPYQQVAAPPAFAPRCIAELFTPSAWARLVAWHKPPRRRGGESMLEVMNCHEPSHRRHIGLLRGFR